MKPQWIALLGLALMGCSDPYRNLYEGIKNNNEAHQSPQDRARSDHPPSYDAYKKERDRLNKNDGNNADSSSNVFQTK